MQEIRRGKVRIPNFQRPFVWKRADAQKFLDSLYRGFPVGTLLFWERSAEAGENMRFGVVNIPVSRRSDAWWVVDGQQRIVSLIRVLLAGKDDNDDFALYFDLQKREIVSPPALKSVQEQAARWLPLTEALDSEKLLAWAYEKLSEHKEWREQAFLLGKRIREYSIPAYIVRANDEGILREIFSRINASGHPLRAEQVFDALNGSLTGTRPASIRQIVLELQEMDFGTVEERPLYKLLRSLQKEPVIENRKRGPLRLKENATENAFIQTSQAAGQVIRFLKVEAGIPHYELLPYKQSIVTLGNFFHYHSTPSPRSRELLVRWLWRGALNGAHMGDTVSTRHALQQIIENEEDASVRNMLAMVSKQPSQNPDVGAAFNFRSASGKMIGLALLELKPRHLLTGESLHIGELLTGKQQGAEIPLSIALNPAKTNAKEFQSAANRLLHPAMEGGLRKLILKARESAILLSHGITPEAVDALQHNDAIGFLNLRRQFLQKKFDLFFASKARWMENDRPAIGSLIIEDED